MSPNDIVKVEMTSSRVTVTVEGSSDPTTGAIDITTLTLSADDVVRLAREKARKK
jgi:hypothetical protein